MKRSGRRTICSLVGARFSAASCHTGMRRGASPCLAGCLLRSCRAVALGRAFPRIRGCGAWRACNDGTRHGAFSRLAGARILCSCCIRRGGGRSGTAYIADSGGFRSARNGAGGGGHTRSAADRRRLDMRWRTARSGRNRGLSIPAGCLSGRGALEYLIGRFGSAGRFFSGVLRVVLRRSVLLGFFLLCRALLTACIRGALMRCGRISCRLCFAAPCVGIVTARVSGACAAHTGRRRGGFSAAVCRVAFTEGFHNIGYGRTRNDVCQRSGEGTAH